MNKRIKKKQARRWIDAHIFYISTIVDWFTHADYYKERYKTEFKDMSIYKIFSNMPKEDFNKLYHSIVEGYPFHDQNIFKKSMLAMRNAGNYDTTNVFNAKMVEQMTKATYGIDITIDVLMDMEDPEFIKAMNGFDTIYFMVFNLTNNIAIGSIDMNRREFKLSFEKYVGDPNKIFTKDDRIVLAERKCEFVSHPASFYCMIPISDNREIILIRTKRK